MLKYWPMIEYKEDDRAQKLSTTSPMRSADMAVKQINMWLNDYGFDITAAKVQIYNDDKLLRTVPLTVVIDSWGRAKRWQLPPGTILGVKAG